MTEFPVRLMDYSSFFCINYRSNHQASQAIARRERQKQKRVAKGDLWFPVTFTLSTQGQIPGYLGNKAKFQSLNKADFKKKTFPPEDLNMITSCGLFLHLFSHLSKVFNN